MIACSKEITLESRINLDELYVIQDDPDDPVKHRIYEIYETYGIPVYFFSSDWTDYNFNHQSSSLEAVSK